MWPGLINARNQESDTVGPTPVVLSVDLSFVSDRVNDSVDRDGAVVEEAGGHGLLAHKVGEDSSIGGEAGEGNTEMCVDTDDLLLIGAELFRVSLDDMINSRRCVLAVPPYLESYQDGMCLADETYGSGSLLYGFQGILDLEDTTLRRAMDLVSKQSRDVRRCLGAKRHTR